ncbi:MAG: peptide-methionine (S)-S-oxide reductase [Promethearchaeota archaeon]|nr:MAG: peptide-methionine (S)-S-oxide reductase [Candidatus Lokiarchaeota archaeon]
MERKNEKALFGAGCFWGVESNLMKVKGVISTRVGYSGGSYENPTYKDVCSGETGHVEVVEVTYNPSLITYERLVEIFFDIHNPTTPNRQGWDIGTQYRSVIFYYNEEQKKIAKEVINRLERSKKFKKSIATQVKPAKEFYKAEEYHQKYHEKHQRGFLF